MNINGLGQKQKIIELESLLNKYKSNIVLLCETRLRNRNKFKLKHYNIIRNDRFTNSNVKNNGVGTAILIKKNINFKKIDYKTDICNLEFSIASIEIEQEENLIAISLYCNTTSENFQENISALLKYVIKEYPNNPVIIGGDLNAKNSKWGDSRNNKSGRILDTIFQSTEIKSTLRHLTPQYPTYTYQNKNYITGSYLDHFIINRYINILHNKAYTLEYLSDHAAIEIRVELIYTRLRIPQIKIPN